MSTDLKRRNVPFSPPDMTEREAEEVKQAILSGWITTGPRTKKLEKLIADYVGVANASVDSTGSPTGQKTPNCVCLNSATAAMEMVLHVLGVGPGDEVIMPAYTYTASASVVDHVGATIKMVDICKPGTDGVQDFEMDYEKLAEAITERTKVIVPVDLAGICANVDKIMEVVNRPEIKALYRPANDIQRKMGRIFVSNDCAHSFGAWRLCNVDDNDNRSVVKRMAGAIADFSSFSFHAVKNFTTAEGGAMTWNLPFGQEKVERQQVYCGSPVPFLVDSTGSPTETWNEFIYRISQLFSLHGQNKDALAKTKLGAWEYDIIGPWYKCNMTDIMAALGLIQFERYPEMLAKRRKYIEMYDKALAPLGVVGLRHYNDNDDDNDKCGWAGSGHLYIARFMGKTREECNRIIELMAERGIATNVHYKPLPMMTAYKAKGIDIKDYPNAYKFFENEITLPLNTKMTEEDVEYVIENLVEILKNS